MGSDFEEDDYNDQWVILGSSVKINLEKECGKNSHIFQIFSCLAEIPQFGTKSGISALPKSKLKSFKGVCFGALTRSNSLV